MCLQTAQLKRRSRDYIPDIDNGGWRSQSGDCSNAISHSILWLGGCSERIQPLTRRLPPLIPADRAEHADNERRHADTDQHPDEGGAERGAAAYSLDDRLEAASGNGAAEEQRLADLRNRAKAWQWASELLPMRVCVCACVRVRVRARVGVFERAWRGMVSS